MSNSQDRWQGWSDAELKGAATSLGDMLDTAGYLIPGVANQHMNVCKEMARRDASRTGKRLVMAHANGRTQIDHEWDLIQTGDDSSSRGQI